MRGRKSKFRVALSLLATGAVVFISGFGNCTNLAFDGASGTLDLCFLFDCTDGIFGGLIDPCAEVFTRPDQPGFIPADPNKASGETGTFFADCDDDMNP